MEIVGNARATMPQTSGIYGSIWWQKVFRRRTKCGADATNFHLCRKHA